MPVVAAEFQEQMLSLVRRGNEIALDAIRTARIAAAVAGDLPVISAIPTPKLPESVASELPAASDVVESAFGFAQRLLDEERMFAREAMKAVAALEPAPHDKHDKHDKNEKNEDKAEKSDRLWKLGRHDK